MSREQAVQKALNDQKLALAGRRPRVMAHVAELEEAGLGPYRRGVIVVVLALVAGFLLWAATQQITETARAPGEIVPTKPVVPIQHLEGGIVSEIFVEEGQKVAADENLLQLYPVGFQAEMRQLKARRASLMAEVERLEAFVEGRQAAFNQDNRYAALNLAQTAFLQSQMESSEDRLAVLQKRLNQRQSERLSVVEELAAIKREVQALQEEVSIYRELYNDGYGTKVQLLQVQRELANAEADRERLQGRLVTLEHAIAEAREQMAESQSSTKEESRARIAQIQGEIAEVDESLARAQDRVNRLLVTAPEAGYIKGLKVHNRGEVLEPGQVMMEIVPTDSTLEVEARVAAQDVGYLHLGQEVSVKVTAYDFAQYGAASGTLTHVSATTFLNEQGQPYYKAKVALKQDYVGSEDNRLLPGMVVQADITTGEKTLIEYLLKPVYTAAWQAFTER